MRCVGGEESKSKMYTKSRGGEVSGGVVGNGWVLRPCSTGNTWSPTEGHCARFF